MNWDRVEGNWKEFKGKVQQQWGKLTNDDIDVIEGKGLNSPGGSNSAMVSRRMTPSVRSTLGSTASTDVCFRSRTARAPLRDGGSGLRTTPIQMAPVFCADSLCLS